jgi:hypothetical protein
MMETRTCDDLWRHNVKGERESKGEAYLGGVLKARGGVKGLDSEDGSKFNLLVKECVISAAGKSLKSKVAKRRK